MELSHEDSLRLNVMLQQQPTAIRIDESSMTVFALTQKGEARIDLNPNCRDEKYLRTVRELFSVHALGSPGGYPIFLKRWTRMGQAREQSLEGLLLLGEPEAIVAVAHAQGLNEQIARRAWWAMPQAEVARKMLANKNIAQSTFAQELIAFLLDYLPFETDPHAIVESVRLILTPGLSDKKTIDSLWSRASRKSTYYVGFLWAIPDDLPRDATANPNYSPALNQIASLVEDGNPYAIMLQQLLSDKGQAFLATMLDAMDKFANQEVVVLFTHAVQKYFHPIRCNTVDFPRNFATIHDNVKCIMASANNDNLNKLLNTGDSVVHYVEAMIALSHISESLLNPIFSQTDAVGSVMRQKLKPVVDPIKHHISILRT